ncbi:MAG: TonB-dependent receptor family protein, partial [Bradymonadia bacterium]
MNQTRFTRPLSSFWTILSLLLLLTGISLASEQKSSPGVNEGNKDKQERPSESEGNQQTSKEEQTKTDEDEDDEDEDEIFDGEAESMVPAPLPNTMESTRNADVKATDASETPSTKTSKPEAEQPSKASEPPPEATPIKTLDVITIIGNQEKLQRASGSAFKVSKKLLETQEHDDVHRVLKQVPGVYIRDEDGFGLRPNIGLRGASSDRSAKVSLMEDGVLMAPAPYAAPAAYYFPLTTRLSGMEVFKGPSAIKYGPNTIGGALNFTTRASIPRGHRGEVDLAMGSFGAQKVHAYFGQGARGFGYIIEGARIDSNGFKDLDTGQETGFQKDDWMFKGHVQSQTDSGVFHRLELKLGFAQEQSNETYLGLTDDDFNATPYRRYAASQLGNMEWARTQAKLHYTGLIGEDIEWNITGYRHDFTRAWRKLSGLTNRSGVDLYEALLDPNNVRYQPFINILKGVSEWSQDPSERLVIGTNDRDYISQGIQSKFELTHRLDTFRHTAEIGLRAHYDEIQRNHSEAEYDMIESTTVRATDDKLVRQNTGKALAFSGYLFNEFSWNERFIITPGVRLESYSMSLEDRQNGGAKTNDETIWLPGVGIWGGLSDTVGVLAGVHRGFSPVAPGQPASTRSETSLNYEAGLRWHAKRFHGEIVGFFNQYENLTGTCTQSAGCD